MNLGLLIKEFFIEIGRIRMAIGSYSLVKHLTKTQVDTSDLEPAEAQEKTRIRKFFEKLLNFIASPGVGTILTVFGAIACLSSPLGIAVGATIATVTMASYSVATIRSTLRMRTIKSTQKKELLLDSLNQKINKTLDKTVNPELRKMANQEIMKILNKSIFDEPINEEKGLVNVISGKIRYLSLTGTANWVLSILSLNPASIALSSTAMLLGNGLSYFGEGKYRKDKDLLDREVSEKEVSLAKGLKKELGIEDKYISKLSNQDLLKILSIKEAEISCGRKTYKSDNEMKDELISYTKKYKDANLQEYKPEVSFIKDFGNLFTNSFNAQKHAEFFAPLSHRENLEKSTRDDELQNLNAFKEEVLLQIDKSGKGINIEMIDLSSNYSSNLNTTKVHHSVKDIIREEGDKLKGLPTKHSVDGISNEQNEHIANQNSLPNIANRRHSRAVENRLLNNNVEKPKRTL